LKAATCECIMNLLTVAAGSVHLLERDAELSSLAEYLDEVRGSGQGRIALVTGEAGVGKTALLRRFADLEERAVLWGGCDPLYTPRPLGALLDTAPHVEELDLLLRGDPTPHDVVAALMRFFGDHPGRVLVLEDVHWADAATLDVVKLLGRRIDNVPVLLVLSYRDDELDRHHPLRVVFGDVAAATGLRRLRVAPLSYEAVEQLAAPYTIDPGELYRKTGGNSFFVVEALAAGDGHVPETVRDAVLARAARLGPSARGLLDAVAIVPPHIETWLLDAIADAGLGALDECVAAGTLQVVDSYVSFRHELARLAVEESILPVRRSQLHARALEALADLPGDVRDFARLAHHADAAHDAGAVRRYAPAAGRHAQSVGAYREAAAQYGRALRFGDDLPGETRAELLGAQAGACYPADLYDEGIAALEQEAELWSELERPSEEGDAFRRLSEFLWCPGRVADARRAALRAVELLEPLGSSLSLAHVYCNLVWLYGAASDSDNASAWALRATELAEKLEARDLYTDARILEAWSRDDVELLVPLVMGGSDSSSHWMLAQSALARGSLDVASDAVERGLVIAEDRNHELNRLYLLAALGHLELRRCNWDRAGDAAAIVLRTPRTSTTPRILSLVVLALIRARRGDPDARPLLDEAWELAEPTGEPRRIGPVSSARAELEWLEGNAQLGDLFADPIGLYESAVADRDVAALEELGARHAADVVRRGLGLRGPRRSTRENPAGLTKRELEVLGLVTEGLSNRTIAKRLVLSERTVDHHVAAILRKLRVKTRAEATAHAVRLGAVSVRHDGLSRRSTGGAPGFA
jgi:DNA-binding CsgD family transcriptional regulator